MNKKNNGPNKKNRINKKNPIENKIQTTEVEQTSKIERGFLFLVKNPSSNEISICAWDSIIYPGTHVVAPTRYGLDIGVVIGSVSSKDVKYNSGCPYIKGACNFGKYVGFDEEDHYICGFLDEKNKIIFQDNKEEEILGEIEFVETDVKDLKLDKTEECDDSASWDPRYTKPEEVDLTGNVLWIDRLATREDFSIYYKNIIREQEAMVVCREKIKNHKLNMKLVTSHFLLEESKVLFFFTADDRVDFRDLVKDLVSVFKLRIELRQIGVRDESRVLGGLAVCGRDFCCHCITDKMNPVTIKMAKEQNLSLNSTKISGPCGRLLCCLSYEYDFYTEEKLNFPPEGSRLRMGKDLLKIIEVNILSKKITLLSKDGGLIFIPRKHLEFSSDNNRWEITKEFQQEFLSN
ncbi:MAG: regulatory iron-sulfur-containing complex subunit RicT [Sphaerochaetaceae bacterium]